MIRITSTAAAVCFLFNLPALGQADAAHAAQAAGISAPGWTGSVDPNERSAGMSVNDDKLTEQGGAIHITTGPATAFWNAKDKASGDYTVKATFTEPKFMDQMTHPHPYGLFIAGNDMGTDHQSYVYCAAYGNGNFIVRGFGPEPFQMNGRRGEANAAVHKADAPGQPVTQDIALSVKGGRVECAINGTVVASYDKAALVAPGKLKSTDGIYGIRAAHNTTIVVTGLGTK
jgi:hypothetical protein